MENVIRWVKARKSDNGGDCLEVGTVAGHCAGIRDSKSIERGHLDVTPERLRALLDAVNRGALELPTRLDKHLNAG